MANPQLEILGRVAALLDACQIGYCVGGSLASSYYGRGRTTADADFIIDLKAGQVDALAASLESDFYVSREAMREAVRERRPFNAIHLVELFKIDFFIQGDAPFDREVFRRRSPKQLEGLRDMLVMMTTAEDTVLRKLQWFRAGGEVSDHQWQDVLGVMVTSGANLDGPYMDRWAATRGVSDLLERARQETSSR